MNKALAIFLILLLSVAIGVTDSRCNQSISIADVIRFIPAESIKLSCNISALGNRCAQWLKDGVALVPSDRVYFGNCGQKFTLTIKKTARDDVGYYTCGAFEGRYLQKFYEANLITKLVVEMPEEETVFAGRDFEIQCNVSGIPMPTIHWRHETIFAYNNITASGGRYILSPLNGTENAKLFMKNISKEEAGNLTCVVDSPFLNQAEETKCRVVVLEPSLPWWIVIAIVAVYALCFTVMWNTIHRCRVVPKRTTPFPVQRSFSTSTSSSEIEFMEHHKEKMDGIRKALAMGRKTLEARKEPDADSGLVNWYDDTDVEEIE